MTVPASTRRVGPFYGNGATTSFPFTFKVFTADDITLTVTDSAGVATSLVRGTHYSVALNPDQESAPGGTVTYPISGSPLPTGSTLAGVGALPYDQTTDFPAGGAYRAQTHENAFDRTVMQVQQLAEEMDRALVVPSSVAGVNVQVPVPQAGYALAWNAAGDGLINVDPQTLATVVAYGTARADQFTGNGTQTLWTLSNDPVNINNLDVSIGGITQLPNIDYSWTEGTTLTTAVPVPLGVTMLVRYMQGLPQSAVGLPSMTGQVGKFLGTDGTVPLWQSVTSAVTTHTATYTGAVARSLLSRLNESVVVTDFGADPTGVADSTPAFLAAIATGRYTILVPEGTFKLTGTLTLIGGQRLIGVGKRRSVLDKAFNGTMIVVPGGYIGVFGLYLKGNGATYTGKGIDVNNAASPYFEVDDCRIIDFQASCIDFSVPEAGSQASIRNSQIYCNTITRPAITLPGSAYGGTGVTTVTDTAATPRFFTNIQASGGTLIDFGNCDNATVSNCWANGFIFGTNSRKVIMNAVRMFNGGGSITVQGLEHNITGLVSAGSVYLQNADSVVINNCVVAGELALNGAANYRCKITRTFPVLGLVDFSGDPTNYVDIASTDNTPTWAAATTNPTLGNGTLVGNWSRTGLDVRVNVSLTWGTTTTAGVGVWTFELPFRRSATAKGPSVGAAFIKRNGVAFYVGVVTVQPGDNIASIYTNAATQAVQGGTPFAWANGDLLQFTLDYSLK